jgi:hypothetical protein
VAGSVALTSHTTLGRIRVLVYTATGDAADGSIPNTVLPKIEGRLIALITNPGAVAPTDNYDITLEDSDGLDRLQGTGANRDTANSEQAAILFASSSAHPPVDLSETLTLKFANNAVNSAVIVATLIYDTGG